MPPGCARATVPRRVVARRIRVEAPWSWVMKTGAAGRAIDPPGHSFGGPSRRIPGPGCHGPAPERDDPGSRMSRSSAGMRRSGPGLPRSGAGMRRSGPRMRQTRPGMRHPGSRMWHPGPGMPWPWATHWPLPHSKVDPAPRALPGSRRCRALQPRPPLDESESQSADSPFRAPPSGHTPASVRG